MLCMLLAEPVLHLDPLDRCHAHDILFKHLFITKKVKYSKVTKIIWGTFMYSLSKFNNDQFMADLVASLSTPPRYPSPWLFWGNSRIISLHLKYLPNYIIVRKNPLILLSFFVLQYFSSKKKVETIRYQACQSIYAFVSNTILSPSSEK